MQSEYISIDGDVTNCFRYTLTAPISGYNELLTEFPLVQGRMEARAVGMSVLVRVNRGMYKAVNFQRRKF